MNILGPSKGSVSMGKGRLSSRSNSGRMRPSFNESINLYAAGQHGLYETHRLLSPDELKHRENAHRHETEVKEMYSTIEALIGNPISCGYLLHFCLEQYNAENLSFILDVDEFRDQFAVDSNELWAEDWRAIDMQVDINQPPKREHLDVPWKSSTERGEATKKIDKIIQKFIKEESESQVCLSTAIMTRTERRIQLINLYGPEVFEEACLDPIKTMQKDILPRFLHSRHFQLMVALISSCEPPPPASELKVPPPESFMLLTYPIEDFPPERQYTLDEVLSCSQIYNEFLTFLQKGVRSENLICVRMIDVFNHQMSISKKKEAGDSARKIYQYFVAPGSAYEVSIHHLDRKRVMLDLATPRKEMFESVRTSAYNILRVHFEEFKKTPEFSRLGQVMLDAKIELNQLQDAITRPKKAASGGCFPFGK